MARLCSLLGNPERTFPAIHVLGTNGKGSVCAAIDSILRESGYRTARYTSPHLDHLGERLTFDGTILPAEAWDEALDLVIGTVSSDSRLSEDPPSAFEIMTVVAFLCIAQGNRQIAVIEAGLGGRLDATNLLGEVRMTVLTSIGLDHEDILGQGIEAIAREKFSVLRRGVPVVSAAGGALLDGLAASQAEKTGSPLSILGRDAMITFRDSSLQGSSFDLALPGFAASRLSTPLLGEHQVDNAALAALACLKLSQRWPGISFETVRRGLEKTSWPGRLERIPLFPPVLLDGAHNPQGSEALSRTLVSLWPGIRPIFVMAAMKDKDIAGMLKALSRTQGELFCTEIQELERCEKALGLAEKALELPWPGPVKVFPDSRVALLEAMNSGPLVVCTGSLYFIGSIRRFLVDLLSPERKQG
jgi:dihydrofolate synthase/folylpolyglutamate synthase